MATKQKPAAGKPQLVWAPGEFENLAQRLRDAGDVSFREMLTIVGLSPERDLRDGLWAGASFDGQDLRGFDFTRADLSGSTFRGALVAGARFSNARLDSGALDEAFDATPRLVSAMLLHPHFAEMFEKEASAPNELIARLTADPNRSSITREELVEIVAKKNARGVGAKRKRKSPRLNSEAAVDAATSLALSLTLDDASKALDALRELRGVEVATASAILSWCKPDLWPVIDQHALNTLVKFDVLPPRRSGGPPRRDEWPPYVAIVTALSERLSWSPQRVDRWLYAFDKCQLSPERVLETPLKRKEEELARNERRLSDALGRAEIQEYRIEALAREAHEQRQRAEEASRAKWIFLANMSHELRTPLNAVIGFSEIMAKELFGPLANPQYKQYASDMFDSGNHLLDLINDILDMSKIEANKLTLAPKPLDPMVAIEQATRLTKRKAEEKGLSLVIDAEDLPEIEADYRAVKQILLNLLSNAVKFTDHGAIMVHARGDPQGLTLRVVDTGCGIPPEHLPRLARPFEQVEQELTRNNHGTGLGLALTKSLVELHGGKLQIQSEVGRGTVVTVTLPRRFGGRREQEAAAS